MSTTMQQSVLVAAKQLINTPETWLQSNWISKCKTRRCPWRAIHDAAKKLGMSPDPAFAQFCQANGLDVHAPKDSIPEWNDLHERTHAQVMAALDAAVAYAPARVAA